MRVYLYSVFNVGRKLLPAVMLPAVLAGCGGGDPEECGLPGYCTNPPATIRISYPTSNAITDLGGGVYSWRGSVVVTDSEGNAVADGTKIKLIVIDSIKAYGTIDDVAGDTISGTTITDSGSLLGDFATPTLGGLNTAYVDRASTIKTIDESDHIFLFTTFELDRSRVVGTISASNPTISTLSAAKPYSVAYPNVPYDGINVIPEYIVGSSLLGSSIAGSGGTVGYTTVNDGIGTFQVTYPADTNHINVGCPLPVFDTRHGPTDSSHTFVYAEVDGFEHVNVIDSGLVDTGLLPPFPVRYPEKTGFCFTPIRGGEIIASQNGNAVEGQCKDGGDSVALPFTEINYSSSDAAVTVTSPAVSNAFGSFTAGLSGAAGATATITLECNGGATTTVDVTLN